MEQESLVSKSKRRSKAMLQTTLHCVIAIIFGITVYLGRKLTGGDPSNVVQGVAIALPLIAITSWWYYIYSYTRKLNEFEQTITTRSLAITCGIILWLVTASGLASDFLKVRELPLVMVAPVSAVIFSITQSVSILRYR